MRLGFYTDYSRDIAQFAQDTGFTSMELSAWPQSSLNADDDHRRTDQGDPRRPRQPRHRDLRAGLLPQLSRPPTKTKPPNTSATSARSCSSPTAWRCPPVCTFVGMTPGWTVEDCMEPFTELFTEFTNEAEDLGIRIGIENCPMLNHKTRTGENLAFSPEIWTAMFDAVPSRRARPRDRPVTPGVPRHRLHPGDQRLRRPHRALPRQGHRHRRTQARRARVLRPGVRRRCRDSATAGGASVHRAGASSTGDESSPR